MSTTVDERVVEMRFDNKNFETNVKTSMSTLDKLKQSLNLTGASRGLENLYNVIGNNNINVLGRAVETVQAKFSSLQVMGITALTRITNAAINAGSRIIKALTIDPVMTGFQEYETQINAVQTILANTKSKGSTLQDVNNALDTLNTYADKTIYNFTEMTRNIGTFTAAGVELNKAVTAIQGIANLAAISGSSSQQASVAMYQLSQALAAGRITLMDWNSVVNAGMGGEIFQQALIRTSENLGTGAEAAIEKYGTFRESLTQGNWLTAEVLTETLTQLSGAYSEADLISQGYSKKQAQEIADLAETAVGAATEVKTFTQLFDTLKEAAQSGWTQTWEIIIGDFDEAKELMTGISNSVGDVINSMSQSRNDYLSGALSSGWKQILNEGISDEELFIETIKKVATEHGVAVDKIIEDSGSFNKSLSQGWLTTDILAESISIMADEVRGLSIEQLKEKGYTREQADALIALDEAIKNGTISLDGFVEVMKNGSGREHIIEGFKNILSFLGSIFEQIKAAYSDIFPPLDSQALYDLTVRFEELTSKLVLTEETADKIRRTFKGLFSILDLLKRGIIAVATPIKDFLLSGVVTNVLRFLLSITASIGDFFTALNEGVGTGELFSNISTVISKAFEWISNTIQSVSDKLGSFKDVCSVVGDKISEIFGVVSNVVGKVFSYITDNMGFWDVFNGIIAAISLPALIDMVMKLKQVIGGGLMGIIFGLGDDEEPEDKKVGVIQYYKNLFAEIPDVLDALKQSLMAFIAGVKVASIVAIAAAIAVLTLSLKALSKIDPLSIIKSLGAMGVMFAMLTYSFKSITTILNTFKPNGIIKAGVAMTFMAVAMLILSSALKKISDIPFDDVIKGLIAIGGGLAIFCAAVNSISKSNAVSLRTSIALIAMAEACKILSDALAKFGELSVDEIGPGLVAMGGALGEVTLALKSLSAVGGGGALLGSAGIFVVAKALGDIAPVVKDLGQMSLREISKGLSAMGGALVEISSMLAILSKVGGGGAILGSAAVLIVTQSIDDIAETLLKLGTMSWPEIGRGLSAMGGALVELATTVGLLGKLGGVSSLIGSTSILIVTQSLNDISDALAKFGTMSWPEIGRGLSAMGGALVELGVVVGLLGKLGGAGSLIGSTSILIVTQSLNDMADALAKFGSMSWDEIGRGLSAMGGALGELGIVLGLLGNFGGPAGIGSLIGGGAILLATQSLNDMADALAKFGSMSWDEIGRGLAAMGGALGEIAVGGFLSTFAMVGSSVLSDIAEPIGALADSVKKWKDVEVPDGLGTKLASLADGIAEFNFSGWGSDAIAAVAVPFGDLADSISKWSDIDIPEGLGEQLEALADGVAAFNFAGMGADGISASIEPLAALVDSVLKWKDVTIPEGLGEQLTTLADGVKAFTFGGWGADTISTVAEPIGLLADSISKWKDVSVPEGLGEQLSSLATGVGSFNFTGWGASAISEVVEPIGLLADSIIKWKDVTIPEGLGEQLSSLATGVSAFNFSGWGADAIAAVVEPIGTLSDSIKKWAGVSIPEGLGGKEGKLAQLADGVSAFNFSGWGADSIDKVSEPLGTLAESVGKWSGVTIPNGLGGKDGKLAELADAIESFTFAFAGGWSIDAIKEPLGDLADSVKRWNDVDVPENMEANLKSLANGVISFNGVSTSSLDGACEGVKTLGEAVNDISDIDFSGAAAKITDFSDAISSVNISADTFENLGSNIVDEFIKSIASGISRVESSINTLANVAVLSFTNAISNASSDSSNAGLILIDSLANGMTSGVSAIDSVAVSVIGHIENIFISKSSMLTSVGRTLITSLANGIDSSGSLIISSVSTTVLSSISAINSKISSFRTAGYYCAVGFAEGITSGSYAATVNARAMAQAAVRAAEEALDEHSPSKVFYGIGAYAGEGFVNAFSDYESKSYNAGYDMAETAKKGLSDAASRINDVISSDIDSRPIISPVIDLSNVKSGASVIGNMLGINPSIDVMSNASAISSMMSRRNQNGVNSEIVSAINRLRSDIKDIDKPSYNINGITYDDGSAVADAIQSLVRAAKVERRV